MINSIFAALFFLALLAPVQAEAAELPARSAHTLSAPPHLNASSPDADEQPDLSGEMTGDDQLRLQQTMERHSQMEPMLSNTMKSASDTAQGAVNNIK